MHASFITCRCNVLNMFIKHTSSYFLKMGMKKMRDKGERFNFKREIGDLRKELRTRETTAITQILKSADVVLSTNTGQNWPPVWLVPLKHSREDERLSAATCLLCLPRCLW